MSGYSVGFLADLPSGPAKNDQVTTKLTPREIVMKLAITGAAGMVGQGVLSQIAAQVSQRPKWVEKLILVDLVPSPVPDALEPIADVIVGKYGDADVIERLVSARPDVIVHLASVVSQQAEQEFELGFAVNFDGTRSLLEAIRLANEQAGYCPRYIFASSMAVFGPPFQFPIPEEYHLTPRTSYGTQKALLELLLNEYSRRKFIDGVGIRLPTVCVRPGKPNAAASGFFSNIIREPLAGKPAVLPVNTHHRHWFVSPKSAARFFLHAMEVDTGQLGQQRNLDMPGVSATVAEQIDALRAVAGDSAVDLIQVEMDPAIEEIVAGWAPGFVAERARSLGFVAEASFEEIISEHISA